MKISIRLKGNREGEGLGGIGRDWKGEVLVSIAITINAMFGGGVKFELKFWHMAGGFH